MYVFIHLNPKPWHLNNLANSANLHCSQGHSLGGCLGTLLMLLFLHRKVIRPHALGPVYTFGAPAVFCEMDSGREPVSPPPCRV